MIIYGRGVTPKDLADILYEYLVTYGRAPTAQELLSELIRVISNGFWRMEDTTNVFLISGTSYCQVVSDGQLRAFGDPNVTDFFGIPSISFEGKTNSGNCAWPDEFGVVDVTSAVDICPAGYYTIPQDLNEGAGGEYVYLCSLSASASLHVVGLRVENRENEQDVNCGDGWVQTGVDLNKGSGGNWIYLCYQQDPTRTLAPIQGVMVTSKDEAGDSCPDGWTWINEDLNKGAGGKYIYICYIR